MSFRGTKEFFLFQFQPYLIAIILNEIALFKYILNANIPIMKPQYFVKNFVKEQKLYFHPRRQVEEIFTYFT